MKQYVGLDVSQKSTNVCVVDGSGHQLWSGKCLSTPNAIAQTVRERAPLAERVGLETGPLCVWHYHGLKALGVPVFCIDARHAKAALAMQLNKTDENDAAGLAQIMRTGWFREVHVKSYEAQLQRSMLQSRLQLVNMRRDASNQVRGALKVFGIVLPAGRLATFDRMARDHVAGREDLGAFIEPLLAAWRALGDQVALLDKCLRKLAKEHQVVKTLMTAPGVGPLIGMAYVATIDDPNRFAKSRNVGAHLGLAPRRYQSGEMDCQGHISKCGDGMLRHYLYEAAGVLLTRSRRANPLKAWGLKLAKRIGRSKARVAVARKLAIILHCMWRTGEAFRWEPIATTSAS
jgi:transposase